MTESAGPVADLRLDTLPIEIQNLIFDHIISTATRAQLKLFRLSNSFFRSRVDIVLFSTLHLSVSTLSLARLCHVADTPLSNRVRHIIFHRGTFRGHSMTQMYHGFSQPKDYGDFEAYIVRNHDLKKHLPRVSLTYSNFEQEVAEEGSFLDRASSWQLCLAERVWKFERLDTVSLLPVKEDLAFSTYFDARCATQWQTCTNRYFAPYEILGTMGRKRLRKVNFEAVEGEDFAEAVQTEQGRKLFEKLRELKLTLHQEVSFPTENYTLLFKDMKQLEVLYLGDLGRCTQNIKNEGSWTRKLPEIVLSQIFPRLTKFCLSEVTMGEDEYLNFLSRHSHTLQEVQLLGWHIPTNEAGEVTGSAVRAIYRFGQMKMPMLKQVLWQGNFSNNDHGICQIEISPRSKYSYFPERVIKAYEYMMGINAEFPVSELLSDELNQNVEQLFGQASAEALAGFDNGLDFLKPRHFYPL